MSRRVSLAGLGLVTAVAVAVLVGVFHSPGKQRTALPAPLANHPAPAFVLKTVNAKRVSLRAERGRIVLLNFWATWCIPCRQEMPLLSRLEAQNSTTLAVLAIDTLEPASAVQSFVKRYRLHLAPLLDSDGKVDAEYRVIAQPVSFWIDRQGLIRAIHYGAMSQQYAEKELSRLERA